jgi:hypothetical protein
MTNAIESMKAEAAAILVEMKSGNHARSSRRFALLSEIASTTAKTNESKRIFRGSYADACAYFGGPVKALCARAVGAPEEWVAR